MCAYTEWNDLVTMIARLVTILILVAGLTACQTYPLDWWHRSGPDYATASASVPLKGDRFVIPPDGNVVGEVRVVRARYEDTLFDIARQYNLGFEEITQANPDIDPWLPGEGTPIFLPTQFILPDAPREGIVLNVATMRLFYFPPVQSPEPLVVITYPVGIGRVGWATPTGSTKVVAKARNPTWYVPASIRREHAEMGDPLPPQVPPGPDNPLGKFTLRLGIPSYLIHGTNKPEGVGMRVSHGCVRLYPEDIEALYKQVSVGTAVRIVNQPILVGWLHGTPYLEAHSPLEDDRRDWYSWLEPLLNTPEHPEYHETMIDWERVARLIDQPRGFPVPIARRSPDLEKVLASARLVENTLTLNLESEQGE